jgi:hypothetical protein
MHMALDSLDVTKDRLARRHAGPTAFDEGEEVSRGVWIIVKLFEN